MPDPQEFNFPGEVMEQLRELNRRVGDIATAQAAQPTRADLQAYVLKAVFDVVVEELRKTDEDQQTKLDELDKRVQSQVQRWLQNIGIPVSIALGVVELIRILFFH
jgi:hypothetical protein